MRAQVLSLSQTSFVEGARAIGASDFHIMFRHILPNVMPIVTVKFVSASQHLLVMGVGLNFIGLWDTTTIDWGTMIQMRIPGRARPWPLVVDTAPRYSSRLCVPCPCVDRV